jgi:putative transposase
VEEFGPPDQGRPPLPRQRPGNAPLEIPWEWDLPKVVEIGWDGTQYELRATYVIQPMAQPIGTKVAGIDLGEIHIAVAHDGEDRAIVNGRELRSKERYRNQTKAKLSALIDRKEKGSRRRKRLAKSKAKQLTKIKHQVREILHKQTTPPYLDVAPRGRPDGRHRRYTGHPAGA